MNTQKMWTLVTGGAKGLGAALCLDLARRGHSILIHYYKSVDEAKLVAEECRKFNVSAEIIQGDFSTCVTTQNFIDECIEKYSDMKFIVQNVGISLVKSAAQTTVNEWNTVFQTNLHAPFTLALAFIPSLKASQGSIINIGIAGAGNLVADVYATAYRIAKTGLLQLTKSLAKELAPYNVNINMVSPGYLEKSSELPKSLATLPMNRLGTFDEVVRVVAFLLEPENKYITGQNIEVSGAVRL